MQTTVNTQVSSARPLGVGSRTGILTFALLSYAIGVAGLGGLILAMAGLVDLGRFRLASDPTGAFLVNIGLLVMFALQHSVMARPGYKAWSARHVHPSLNRACYVLASGAAILLMLALWQPLEASIWQTTGAAAWLMWSIFAFGWAYLLAASFAINHFDLFGLRQAWYASRNEDCPDLAFKEHWMYRYSRHPIMLGVLIGIWFPAHMDGSRLMLSIGLSLYMLIGIYFEERDLVRQWGAQYEDYKKRVGALWTLKPGA